MLSQNWSYVHSPLFLVCIIQFVHVEQSQFHLETIVEYQVLLQGCTNLKLVGISEGCSGIG